MAAMRDVLKRDAQFEYHVAASCFLFRSSNGQTDNQPTTQLHSDRLFYRSSRTRRRIHSKPTPCVGLFLRVPILVSLSAYRFSGWKFWVDTVTLLHNNGIVFDVHKYQFSLQDGGARWQPHGSNAHVVLCIFVFIWKMFKGRPSGCTFLESNYTGL